MSNQKGQSGLWGYGISGDLPIVLVRIRNADQLELIRQAIQAHAYWRVKGLVSDLVIWNEDDSIYRQNLQEMISNLVVSSNETVGIDRPGGVFIRRGEQMSNEDRVLLQSVARIVLYGENGTMAEQTERRSRLESTSPPYSRLGGPSIARSLGKPRPTIWHSSTDWVAFLRTVASTSLT
jgi:cellobiose phosphorylase